MVLQNSLRTNFTWLIHSGKRPILFANMQGVNESEAIGMLYLLRTIANEITAKEIDLLVNLTDAPVTHKFITEVKKQAKNRTQKICNYTAYGTSMMGRIMARIATTITQRPHVLFKSKEDAIRYLHHL